MTATLVGVDELIHSPRHRRYLLRHTFSGAALTPSDLGPSLTTLSGTPTVSGGVFTNGSASAQVGANVGSGDIVAQARFRFDPTSVAVDRRGIICVRSNLAGSADSIEATLSRSGGNVTIGYRSSGALTSLGSTGYPGGVLDSVDYWLRVTASGSNLSVLTSTDGVTFTSRLTTTSALYLTQGGVELRIQDAGAGGSGGGAVADDLLVWSAS